MFGKKGARTSAIVNGTSYSIQGLSPLTTYEIQAATRNWGRTGPFSEPVRVQTFDGSIRKYKCIDKEKRGEWKVSMNPFVLVLSRSVFRFT